MFLKDILLILGIIALGVLAILGVYLNNIFVGIIVATILSTMLVYLGLQSSQNDTDN